VSKALQAHVRAAAQAPLADNDRVAMRWLWALKHLGAEGQARDLIWEIIEGGGVWTLEEVLGALVPVGTASDGRSSWESLGELDRGSVDDLLGLDRTLEVLDLPDGQSQVSLDAFERRRLPVTLETRRQYALTVMARIKAERAKHGGATSSE
jgi:hypothetical protein